MKAQLVYGYLVKRYKITLGEAAKTWSVIQPEPTENIRIDNVDQLREYLDKLEAAGGYSFAGKNKKEDKPMAKANTNTDVVKGLLEKYNSTEDSAEKAKLRRQMRKAGYYLSKQGGDTPAPAKPAVQPKPETKVIKDGGGIMVTIKKDGKTIEGFVIPSDTVTLTIELN